MYAVYIEARNIKRQRPIKLQLDVHLYIFIAIHEQISKIEKANVQQTSYLN
jgi:hypothetical protein